MGEPIVNSPADAVRCFYTTGIDALVLGDYVLTKGEEGKGAKGQKENGTT
jgi:carbamoyltransferase